MSTESSRDKPSGQDFNLDASDVIVVLEDERRPPQVIKQHFQLRARYSSHASVFFRLSPVTDNASIITTGCLQIKAGDIKSLEKAVYSQAHANKQGPDYLEVVRELLNGMHSVTRLRFQLRSYGNTDLIGPSHSDTHNMSGDPILDTCASLRPIAAASLFSLYFRHDILPRKTFSKYVWAIKQFRLLTEAEKQPYNCMVDVRRLYHGTGDKVHQLYDYNGPSPTRDPCGTPAPGTPASCGSGSTLPFDEFPPRRGQQGSPPPYDECVAEGQSPRARSDAAAIFATSSGGDCDLPEYGDAKRRDDVLDPLPDVLPFVEEDGDIRSTTKRKRSFTTVRTTTTSAADATRHEKLQRTLFINTNDDSQVASLHASQQQQPSLRGQPGEELQDTVEQLRKTVGELQKEVDELQAWKKTHEELLGDLGGTCFQLAERQKDFDDAIDGLSCDVDELGGKHDELGKQLLDVGDEVRETMEDMGSTVQEEICKTIDDSVAKKIEEIIERHVKEIKRKICKALQPI